jgi:hypothetical protein
MCVIANVGVMLRAHTIYFHTHPKLQEPEIYRPMNLELDTINFAIIVIIFFA